MLTGLNAPTRPKASMYMVVAFILYHLYAAKSSHPPNQLSRK
jgi:hypothetical protein